MVKYEEPLAHQLIQITKKYLSAFAEAIQEIPIERYHYVLLIIDENNETLTQKALADILQVDKSFMVTMIDYLTENGLVYRETNTDDRRQQVIKLKPAARKLIPDISNSISVLNKEAFKSLSESKIQTFLEVIETIQTNLSNVSTHEIVLDYKKVQNQI